MQHPIYQPLIRTLQAGILVCVTLALAASATAAPKTVPAEKAVASAFKAALAGDFDAYLKTVHPSERANDKQTAQIKRYAWSRFVRQAAWYLKDKDPNSFVVTKSDGGGSAVRIFIKDVAHKSRMPVPVRLKKNPDGKSWGIVANSL
jgi:hypothetical protein